jgi:phage shock protein PspC (stress-responsive transcriptional regulator)
MKRRIYRQTESKVIAGVCSGLGDYFDVDPTWIRLLFLLAIFANGLGLLAYVIAWIVIPSRPVALGAAPSDSASQTSESALPATSMQKNGGNKRGVGFWPGIILIILGMLFISHHYFFWLDLEDLWPAILIGLGAVLIYRAIRPHSNESEASVAQRDEAEVANGS